MEVSTVTGEQARGFTLIELLVVMTLIATLLAIAAPAVTKAVLSAKEAALRENLFVMRKALDDFYADKGHYPSELGELARQRYLRSIPHDPVAPEQPWSLVRAEDVQGIRDINSSSDDISTEGTPYASW